jgi:hypothetical protein
VNRALLQDLIVVLDGVLVFEGVTEADGDLEGVRDLEGVTDGVTEGVLDFEGVIVRGVTKDFNWDSFQKYLISGRLPEVVKYPCMATGLQLTSTHFKTQQ